eukprot:5152162-Amphidinium_carterae.2
MLTCWPGSSACAIPPAGRPAVGNLPYLHFWLEQRSQDSTNTVGTRMQAAKNNWIRIGSATEMNRQDNNGTNRSHTLLTLNLPNHQDSLVPATMHHILVATYSWK